jgi:hypothetical protein
MVDVHPSDDPTPTINRAPSAHDFSRTSPTGTEYFHATSFRGWPDQPLRDAVLRADAALRTVLLDTVLRGRYVNPHAYKRHA